MISGALILAGILIYLAWSGLPAKLVQKAPKNSIFLPNKRQNSGTSNLGAVNKNSGTLTFFDESSAAGQDELPIAPRPRYLTQDQVQDLSKGKNIFPTNQINYSPQNYSQEEIFKLQYPDYYVAYLGTLQDLMVEGDYMKKTDANLVQTHKDVYKLIKNYLNYLAKNGDVIFKSNEAKDQYIDHVIATMFLLDTIEAELLEKGLIAAK